MLYRSILGIALLSAVSVSQAAIEPKFDYQSITTQLALSKAYDAETHLTLQSDKFQMRSQLNGVNFSQGTNLLVNINGGTISLVTINDDQSLTLKEEFTTAELGLEENSVRKIVVSQDDQFLFILSYTRDDNNQYRNSIHTFKVDDIGLTETENTEVYAGNSSYGLDMNSSLDGTQLLVSSESQNEFRVFDIAPSTKSLSLANTGSTGYFDIEASVLDSANGVLTLVFESYSASANSCITSYSLNDDGTVTIIDDIKCNDPLLPSRINIADPDPVSGDIFVHGYTDFAILNVDSAGSITGKALSNTVDAFGETGTVYPMLENGAISYLSNSYPEMLYIYSYDSSGNMALESETNITDLSGSYFSQQIVKLKENFWIQYNSSEANYALLSSNDTQEITWHGSQELRENSVMDAMGNIIIHVDENLIVTVKDRNINLINTQQNKNFSLEQSLEIENSSYSSSSISYKKMADNKYLIYSSSYFAVFTYNPETKSLTLINSKEFLDSEQNRVGIYTNGSSLLGAWMSDQFFVGKSSYDRLSVFELVGDSLVFREYLVDLVNGINGINNTTNMLSGESEIYMVQNSLDSIAKLSYADGEFSITEEIMQIQGLDSYSTNLNVGNKILMFQNNMVFSFQSINGELEFLSLSPIEYGMSAAINLDDRQVLIIRQRNLDFYSVDETSGALIFLSSIDYNLTDLPSHSLYASAITYDNSEIWYYNSYNQSSIGNFKLNRAPVWERDSASQLLLSQGQSKIFDLDNLIIDLDSTDLIRFNDIELPNSLTIGEPTNEMSFDGSLETSDSAVVGASDTNLSANFTFAISYNFAPKLTDVTAIIEVNANDSIALNMVAMFEDAENDTISVALADNYASLEMLSNGTLTGQFSGSGDQLITMNARDDRGANVISELTFLVNGAPTNTGASSFNGKVKEDMSVDLNALFTDPENDPITLAISNLPAGLNLAGGVISGKPTSNGTYTLIVSATDEKGAASESILTFNIEEGSSGGGGSLGFLLIPLAFIRFWKIIKFN